MPPTTMPSLVEVEAAAAAVRAVLGEIAAALPGEIALPRVTVLLATAVAVPTREVGLRAVPEVALAAQDAELFVVVVVVIVSSLEATAAWVTSTSIPTSYPKETSYPIFTPRSSLPQVVGCRFELPKALQPVRLPYQD